MLRCSAVEGVPKRHLDGRLERFSRVLGPVQRDASPDLHVRRVPRRYTASLMRRGKVARKRGYWAQIIVRMSPFRRRVKRRGQSIRDDLLRLDVVGDEALRAMVSIIRSRRSEAGKVHLVIDAAPQEASAGKVAGPPGDQGNIDRAAEDGQLRLVDETVHERQQPRAVGLQGGSERSEQVPVPGILVFEPPMRASPEHVALEGARDVVGIAVWGSARVSQEELQARRWLRDR